MSTWERSLCPSGRGIVKPGKKKDTAPFGSVGYAPPEQFGKTQTTVRSDIYGRALKRIVYEQAGAPEYWLVDEKRQTIELFALEGNECRSLGEFTGEQRLPLRIAPHMDVPIAHFFDWSKGLL